MNAREIYAAARQAGMNASSAVVATAIALAESGGRPDARGDVNLQDATWGPSVGLMQIRTLKAETGTGGARDILRLTDPVNNMTSAWKISGQGKDWTPWSVFTNGRYQAYLGQAQTAAEEVGTGDAPSSSWGPSWLPWNLARRAGDTALDAARGAVGEAAGSVLDAARPMLVTGAFVSLGLGLVVLGAVVAVSPRIRSAVRTVLP